MAVSQAAAQSTKSAIRGRRSRPIPGRLPTRARLNRGGRRGCLDARAQIAATVLAPTVAVPRQQSELISRTGVERLLVVAGPSE
jgi:hypothetical protein